MSVRSCSVCVFSFCKLFNSFSVLQYLQVYRSEQNCLRWGKVKALTVRSHWGGDSHGAPVLLWWEQSLMSVFLVPLWEMLQKEDVWGYIWYIFTTTLSILHDDKKTWVSFRRKISLVYAAVSVSIFLGLLKSFLPYLYLRKWASSCAHYSFLYPKEVLLGHWELLCLCDAVVGSSRHTCCWKHAGFSHVPF